MLCPQNGDRIVTTSLVTSLHPVHKVYLAKLQASCWHTCRVVPVHRVVRACWCGVVCCTLWVTATPCQLHCRPRGRLFSVMLRDMVVDGTPCRPGRRDVCIGGRCRVSLLHAPLPHRFTETSFFWNFSTHYLFNRLKFKLIFISPPGLRETQSKVGLCFATVSLSSF